MKTANSEPTLCISMIKNLQNKIDLVLAILIPLLSILFIYIPSLQDTIVRTVLGLSLVFFLSGYSLISMLFPRRNELEWIERFILSFGLSIVIVPLFGLILNYTPYGIRLEPILIVLSIFTIFCSLVAWMRRMKLPIEDKFKFPFEIFKFNLGQTVLDNCLSIVLLASIIGSCATLIYGVVTPNNDEQFTEFYILGSDGTASDYPSNLMVGEEGEVIIGLVNHERENVTYRLKVIFNGVLIYEEHLSLIENEKGESPFIFKATKKGENQRLEFLLYKEQQSEIYRTLHLWVNVI